MRLQRSCCLLGLALWAAAKPAAAQVVGERVHPKGPQLGERQTARYQVGVIVEARSGPCRGIAATVPIPRDWPEQSVNVVDEEKSRFVGRVRERTVGGTVRQLVIEIPFLPAGAEARALYTFEIDKRAQLPPPDTSVFRLPERPPRDVATYLAVSPYIESNNLQIKRLAQEILEKHSDADAWRQVEALYDWVRENVEYKNGPLKGALRALKDGDGDCEELSSLFIALCRANKIPSRTVWIPGHCYPEFYLEDDEGEGHWIPCQAAGSRSFGGMPEFRPILQKGDNFTVPERPRDKQRYVAEFLTGKGGQPTVRFVREMVDE